MSWTCIRPFLGKPWLWTVCNDAGIPIAKMRRKIAEQIVREHNCIAELLAAAEPFTEWPGPPWQGSWKSTLVPSRRLAEAVKRAKEGDAT